MQITPQTIKANGYIELSVATQIVTEIETKPEFEIIRRYFEKKAASDKRNPEQFIDLVSFLAEEHFAEETYLNQYGRRAVILKAITMLIGLDKEHSARKILQDRTLSIAEPQNDMRHYNEIKRTNLQSIQIQKGENSFDINEILSNTDDKLENALAERNKLLKEIPVEFKEINTTCRTIGIGALQTSLMRRNPNIEEYGYNITELRNNPDVIEILTDSLVARDEIVYGTEAYHIILGRICEQVRRSTSAKGKSPVSCANFYSLRQDFSLQSLKKIAQITQKTLNHIGKELGVFGFAWTTVDGLYVGVLDRILTQKNSGLWQHNVEEMNESDRCNVELYLLSVMKKIKENF